MRRNVLMIILVGILSMSLCAGCACEHELGMWETAIEKTCEEDGQQVRKCLRCDYEETRVIEAGHSWIDATCQHAQYCEKCQLTMGEVKAHNIGLERGNLTCEYCTWTIYFNTSLPHPSAPTQDYLGIFVYNGTDEIVRVPAQLYIIGGYSCYQYAGITLAPGESDSIHASSGSLFYSNPMYISKTDTTSADIEVGGTTYHCTINGEGIRSFWVED